MANLKLNTIVYNGVNYLDLPDSTTNTRDSFMHESIFSQLVSGANLDSFVINNKTLSSLEDAHYPIIKLGNRANVLVPIETLAAINRTNQLFSANTDVYLNGKLIDENTTIEIGEVQGGEIKRSLFVNMKEGKLIFKSNITTIGISAFGNNPNLTEIIFEGDVGTIGTNCFSLSQSKLVNVTFKGNVGVINAQAFLSSVNQNRVFDFSNSTSIPSLQNITAFTNYTKTTFIVPDSLYDDWIAATNWAALAKYIKKASEVNN